MDAYELMIKTNHHLIRDGVLTDAQKATIARKLREGKITDGRRRTFDAYAYPRFYIPPHNNGKKLQTIIPISPKTNIVADNAYEYEIIRLLHQFAPDAETAHMIAETKARLKRTCFGYQSCHYAECFEAGLMVLRFLSFAALDERDWIAKQITMYNNHFKDRKHHNGVQKFYWLILSELPQDIAQTEVKRQENAIIDHLNRSYLIKNGTEDVALYAMRNALMRLPAYAYLNKRAPFTDEKTGRLRFALS